MPDVESDLPPGDLALDPEGEAAAQEPATILLEGRLGLHWKPLWLALVVAGVLFGGAVVFRLVAARFGASQETIDLDFATRAALVASAGTGYALAAVRWVGVESFRDLQALGLRDAHVDPVREPQRVLGAPLAEMRRSRWAGLAGILFFVATIEVPNYIAGAPPFATWVTFHSMSYMLVLGVLFFWIAGRIAFFSVLSSRVTEQDDRSETFDLLDTRPLAIHARLSLRTSLAWVIGFSIASLIFLNPEVRFVQSLIVFLPILLITAAIASATFLLPLRDLRRRVAAAKRAELARVEAAIRGEPGALHGSRLEARGGAESLADLIAYRGLIDAVPEWPFDASALRRFGLYLLIPIASWVGGALVERLVSSILD